MEVKNGDEERFPSPFALPGRKATFSLFFVMKILVHRDLNLHVYQCVINIYILIDDLNHLFGVKCLLSKLLWSISRTCVFSRIFY
jgi:hypothetical protein